MKLFKVEYKSKYSQARLGKIATAHGVINTPAFVPVGTKGTIKSLTPELVKNIRIQVAFVNTYHLVTHPGTEIIEKAGGIQKYSQLNIPLMSDSGGFQVFSLARKQNQSSKIKDQNHNSKIKDSQTRRVDVRGEEDPILVKISEDGVKFRSTFDGKLIEFTPEKSMEYQRQIGADINMAFDECTYYPATHEYAEKAMERTHEWLTRCLKARYRVSRLIGTPPPNSSGSLKSSKQTSPLLNNQQFLYGVIQGSTFKDLRKKSAEFVVSQNTPGVAIGGVSVGETKKEMREQVKWVSEYLPKNRPVHLLGVGQIDDIIDLVKYGIDTFDCVEPTRLARMGSIYQMENVRCHVSRLIGTPPPNSSGSLKSSKQTSPHSENLNIIRTIYKNNLEKLDVDCDCYVCQNFTKSYLHHLFKQREILGYTLATFHNLWVMEKLFDKIREAITNNLI